MEIPESLFSSCSHERVSPAEAHFGAFRKRHLGEMLGLEKEPEFLGDWKGMAADVGDLLGLHRSPLCSFHRSSSFSMESLLLTFDSFSRDSCSAACSVESCLGKKKKRKDCVAPKSNSSSSCLNMKGQEMYSGRINRI